MKRFLSANLRKSLADVTRRRGRTLLVVMGILIGVAGLTAVNFTEDTLISAYTFTLGVHANWPDIDLLVDRLDNTLLPALAAVSGVQVMQYHTVYQTSWQVAGATGPVDLAISSYPDLRQIPLTPFELIAGRYPNAGEIVMEYSDKSIQNFEVGDLVTVLGAQGETPLRVVGLARTPGVNPAGPDKRALGYMSDEGLRQLAGTAVSAKPGEGPLIQSIQVRVQSADLARSVAGQLQQVLQTNQVTVLNATFPKSPSTSLDQISGVFLLLRLLAVLALTMAAFLILNTVMTLVAEQTAIIGTMKALGGTFGKIMLNYLTAIGLYSLLGTIPGVGLGLAAGHYLATYLADKIPLAVGPFTVAPGITVVSLAVGFVVPPLAALLPLWKGTRITVREALAAYGVAAFPKGRDRLGLQDRVGLGRITWFPQTVWLGLRGTFRKRWRAALVVLTLAIAGTCFLVVQIATGSVNATVAVSTDRFLADIDVHLRGDMTAWPAWQQLGTLPNVQRIERHRGTHGSTQWGDLSILGFEPDTQLYHYQLTSGRWIRDGDANVVLLSDDAAEKTGLKVGQQITVQSLNGQVATWTIIGTIKQPTNVIGWIGSAVTTVDTALQFEGTPSPATSATELLVQAKDRSPQAAEQLTRQLNSAGGQTTASGPGVLRTVQADPIADYTARRQQSWLLIYALLYGAALIVGGVGILGLANALAASVLERRREIAILRTLGASDWRVGQVFLVETQTLVVLACGVAALVGVPAAYAFVQLLRRSILPVEFSVEPAAFGVMLAATVGVGVLASLVPAWRASRMRLSELLRYE